MMKLGLAVLVALTAPATAIQKSLVKWSCSEGSHCDNDVEPLGCFEQGPSTPFCHLMKLPQSISYIRPEFIFYPPGGSVQKIDFFKLADSVKALKDVDTSKELFFISHGFGSGWPRAYMLPMVKALNGIGKNVIVVKWNRGSATPDYFQAASNTRIVGAAVARVLARLSEIRGFSPATTTLIGFSLGSHVSGFAGAHTPGLKRIIALDPAGPLFATSDPSGLGMNPVARLNNTDAKLVQAIHTDGFNLALGGMGTMESFGHVDFFPNGGQIQPGCGGGPKKVFLGNLVGFDFSSLVNGVACPHTRATWLLVSAITNLGKEGGCRFKAYSCGSAEDWLAGKCTTCPSGGCLTVGPATDVDNARPGRYFFQTRDSDKSAGMFCGDEYRVDMAFDDEIRGHIYVKVFDAAGKKIGFADKLDAFGKGSLSTVVAVDFGATPASVKVYFDRSNNVLRRGPKSFNIKSVSFKPMDGVKGGAKSSKASKGISGGEEVQMSLA